MAKPRCYFCQDAQKKGFAPFDTSSMLELSKRTQQDSGDDLMTVPRNPRHAAPNHGAKENHSPIASLRVGAGVVLVLLLPSCGFTDRTSTASLCSRKDLARELIPAGSVITANPDWAIETWSGRKAYTFETPFSQAEYRSWAKQKLGADWHCHAETGVTVVFTRLLPTEQQILDIGFDVGSPQRIRVTVTFTAIPT